MDERSITAIVVTYNRCALLMRCLSALANQTRKPARILVVDNASTDGTLELLESAGWLAREDVRLLRLAHNTGGAGGFSAGLNHAIHHGAEWAWMMDDDAEPHNNALEELIRVIERPSDVYGSLAVNENETSWPMTLEGAPAHTTCLSADIPTKAEVRMLPFLGFLIHKDLVAKIGLPDAAFFIAADDVEYCVRAQRAGAKIFVAGKSHIEHPKSRPYQVKIPGYTLTSLELPPWKRYYDTRNRLLVAREHYGLKLFTHTIPGSFVRMIATLVREPGKLAQLGAFFAGFIDGVLGRKGCRHKSWGIKQ